MKTVKTLAVATVLTLVPALSFAMGCNYGSHDKQAQSCIAGTSWDDATQTCVPITTG